MEGLSAKQRVEWAQEDTVGGWDARRADLTELGNAERDWNLGEDDEDRLRALQAAAAGAREPSGPVEVGKDVEIDEVHVDQLLPHAFLTRYVLPRRPVLIRGVTNNWVWADNWRKKAFIKRYGATERFNITVDVETADHAAGIARAQREVSLAEFVKKVSAANGGKGKKKGKKKQKARGAPAGSALPLPQRVRGKRATPWLINTRESALRDSRPFLKALDAIPKFKGWMDEAAQNGSTFYLPQAQEWDLDTRLGFLREALFTLRLAKQNLANPVLLLLRKVITFYRKDLRVGTGPERLGSLTHDSEAAPKVTSL